MYIYIILVGLHKTSANYAQKQKEGKSPEKTMFELAWDIEELGRINETGRKLIIDCDTLKEKLLQPGYNRIAANFARQLRCFRDKALLFVKQVTKYRRTPATHILVVMISPEERNRKPYAIPVQCLAYTSLTDGAVRRICDALIKEMAHRDMKVAGKKL